MDRCVILEIDDQGWVELRGLRPDQLQQLRHGRQGGRSRPGGCHDWHDGGGWSGWSEHDGRHPWAPWHEDYDPAECEVVSSLSARVQKLEASLKKVENEMPEKLSLEAKADERHYGRVLQDLEKQLLMAQKETEQKLNVLMTTMEEERLKLQFENLVNIQATLRDHAATLETLEEKLLKAQRPTDEKLTVMDTMMLEERFKLQASRSENMKDTDMRSSSTPSRIRFCT
eukprot:TRINITY_DN22807_c0_g1_i6.p1 TRINITY_DN22807_c0_g1~~TRINITY_DN22807_c0_g1_i6.p1  ORF type:complete len:228 (-),score=53.85 TRINITY_DN22807_c0_g1_i6:176-859(-)